MPAWSFTREKRGNDKKITEKRLAPGPGNYENQDQSKTKLVSPSWKWGSSERDVNAFSTYSPGPGTYEEKFKSKAPSFTIPQTRFTEKMKEGPGPGTYAKEAVREISPHSGFVFGSHTSKKISFENRKEIPGPGDYSLTQLNLSSIGSMFGRSQRNQGSFLRSSFVPGPGTYEGDKVDVVKAVAPSIKFGSTLRIETKLNNSPWVGPGSYSIPHFIGQEKKGITISSRNTLKKSVSGNPGPGYYDPTSKFATESFSFSRTILRDFSSTNPTPGPGQYEGYSRNHSPSWRIGEGKRLSYEPTKHFPGPGQYKNTQEIGSSSPKLTLSPKYSSTKYQESSRSPGPGSYDPSLKVVRSNFPDQSIGKERREVFPCSKFTLLGPGTYNLPPQPSRPHIKFPIAQRSNLSKSSESPGPGEYNLYPHFGALPSYEQSKIQT